MIKNAKVEIGKTPSVVSGKPSEAIVNGEAVRKDEIKIIKKANKQLRKI